MVALFCCMSKSSVNIFLNFFWRNNMTEWWQHFHKSSLLFFKKVPKYKRPETKTVINFCVRESLQHPSICERYILNQQMAARVIL